MVFKTGQLSNRVARGCYQPQAPSDLLAINPYTPLHYKVPFAFSCILLPHLHQYAFVIGICKYISCFSQFCQLMLQGIKNLIHLNSTPCSCIILTKGSIASLAMTISIFCSSIFSNINVFILI